MQSIYFINFLVIQGNVPEKQYQRGHSQRQQHQNEVEYLEIGAESGPSTHESMVSLHHIIAVNHLFVKVDNALPFNVKFGVEELGC